MFSWRSSHWRWGSRFCNFFPFITPTWSIFCLCRLFSYLLSLSRTSGLYLRVLGKGSRIFNYLPLLWWFIICPLIRFLILWWILMDFFNPGIGGVTKPLSTNIICGEDGEAGSGPSIPGGTCAQPSYSDWLALIFTILSPTNFVPTGMKSKSNILNTSSPSWLCSSTHCCTSSSEEETCKGITWVDGDMLEILFLLSSSMALASRVLLYVGTSCSSSISSSSPSSSSSRKDSGTEGKGTIFLVTFLSFLHQDLDPLLFYGGNRRY